MYMNDPGPVFTFLAVFHPFESL